MGYHSTLFTNKELRRTLKKHFTAAEIDRMRLSRISGKPAKHRGVITVGNRITIFGSDFIAWILIGIEP
jgi:hypothetical protein